MKNIIIGACMLASSFLALNAETKITYFFDESVEDYIYSEIPASGEYGWSSDATTFTSTTDIPIDNESLTDEIYLSNLLKTSGAYNYNMTIDVATDVGIMYIDNVGLGSLNVTVAEGVDLLFSNPNDASISQISLMLRATAWGTTSFSTQNNVLITTDSATEKTRFTMTHYSTLSVTKIYATFSGANSSLIVEGVEGAERAYSGIISLWNNVANNTNSDIKLVFEGGAYAEADAMQVHGKDITIGLYDYSQTTGDIGLSTISVSDYFRLNDSSLDTNAYYQLTLDLVLGNYTQSGTYDLISVGYWSYTAADNNDDTTAIDSSELINVFDNIYINGEQLKSTTVNDILGIGALDESKVWTNDAGDQYYLYITDTALVLEIVAVPEPATIALLLGVLGLGFAIYRRKSTK